MLLLPDKTVRPVDVAPQPECSLLRGRQRKSPNDGKVTFYLKIGKAPTEANLFLQPIFSVVLGTKMDMEPREKVSTKARPN